MRLEDAPEKGVVGLNVDSPLLLSGNFLLVLNGLDDTGNGRAGEAEEQDLLPRPQMLLRNLRGLENGHRGLAGARPPRDEEVAFGRHDLKLLLS